MIMVTCNKNDSNNNNNTYFICFTIVDFPDSPAPKRQTKLLAT